MSADPLLAFLDWFGQLLKEHGLIEEQREESGYDPDYDTELPPECFKTTAWEIVFPIVRRCIPGQALDEKRLREFLAARNLLRPDNSAFLRWTREGDVPEFLAVQRELENLDLGRLAVALRREIDRDPLQEHAGGLAEFCELVDPQQFALSAASEPADKKPSKDEGTDFEEVSLSLSDATCATASFLQLLIDHQGRIPLDTVMSRLQWSSEKSFDSARRRANEFLLGRGLRWEVARDKNRACLRRLEAGPSKKPSVEG